MPLSAVWLINIIFQPAPPPNKSIIDLIFDISMHVYVYVFLKEIIVSMTVDYGKEFWHQLNSMESGWEVRTSGSL